MTASYIILWDGCEIFSKFVGGNNKIRIVRCAAVNHPTPALQLVDQIGLSSAEKKTAFREIPQRADTVDDQTNTYKVVTTYLASLPTGEGKNSAEETLLRSIFSNAARGGCDAATQWFAWVGFIPKQIDELSYRNLFINSQQPGKSIEWLGEVDLSEERQSTMKDLLRSWTYVDRKGVNKWKESSPKGPIKNIAINSIIVSVSTDNPQLAERWTMTLPQGENQAQMLDVIHQNWPKNDEAAKKAFTIKHGIQ